MNWENLAVDLIEASVLRPIVLVAAAACALSVLRVKHPASRHTIWAATLAGMLFVPLLSILIPHFHVPVPASLDFRAKAPVPNPSAASLSLKEALNPPPSTNFSVQQGQPRLEGNDTLAASSVSDLPARRGMPFVLWLYLAGLLVMVGQRVTGALLLRRVLSRSKPLRRRILRESGDVLTPVTAGFLKPVVLLPYKWREWDSTVRRLVLAHEFAHIRRRDTLVSTFGRFVRCVLWFHPLVWWVEKRMSEQAEMACDMDAVRACGNPAAYAQILLDCSADIRRSGRRAMIPGLDINGRSGLGKRIERILSPSTGSLGRLVRPGVVIGVIGLPVLCMAAIAGVGARPLTIMPPIPQFGAQLLAPPPPPPPPPTPGPFSTLTQEPTQPVRDNTGVLAGRVVLSGGSAASNLDVIAMRGPERDGGITTSTIVARTRTDSMGRYRLEAPPGLYSIVAGWPLATYYPGVTDEDRIRSVPVALGQTVTGLDFAVDRHSGIRVRGRIVRAPAQADSTFIIGLTTYVDPLVRFRFPPPPLPNEDLGLIPVNPDGSFEFPVVAPGVYGLRVFPEKPAPNERPAPNGFSAVRRLVVANEDINVDLPAPVFVTGRIVLEGDGQLPVSIYEGDGERRARPGTAGVQADGPEGYTASVFEDGSFSFALRSGQYRFSLRLPFGYYTKALSYGATDLLRAPLDLSGPPSSEIVGVITTTPPDSVKTFVTVRGRVNLVNPVSGTTPFLISPLVAVLYSEESDRFGYLVLGSSWGNLSFEFRGVPPGTYRGYVTMPGERYEFGKTIVVTDKDLSDVELPLNPNLGRPR